MHFSLFMRTDATILVLLLFLGCIVMVIIGHKLRNKFLKPDEPESKGGVNSLLGALFGLWGFLLAFTFANSATRFENVRSIMVDETNAIRTTILRSKVFPDSINHAYQAELATFLQARIDYYNFGSNINNTELFQKAREQSIASSNALWQMTIEVSRLPNIAIPTSANMMASLTTMFDVITKRDALLLAGVPEAVQYLLFFLAMTISFIGGFTTPVIKQKEWIIVTGFVLLACCIIYITLDMARPMRGFIRPESGAQRIEELQRMLK
jgi:hypothetical protein